MSVGDDKLKRVIYKNINKNIQLLAGFKKRSLGILCLGGGGGIILSLKKSKG